MSHGIVSWRPKQILARKTEITIGYWIVIQSSRENYDILKNDAPRESVAVWFFVSILLLWSYSQGWLQ
jgi:hypothetical protein